MRDEKENKVIYRHVSLKGTSYEIGRKEAEIMKEQFPEGIDFWFKGNEMIHPASIKSIREVMELINQYSPNMNEEIRGFAEYFNRTAEEVIYYSFSHVGKGNCGHFTVLSNTDEEHIYAGRSYEWDADEDKLLLTIKAEGSYSHMGFSLLFFGRYDGMNEKGLCVTMSNAAPCIMSEEEGLRFWLVIRIILDTCKDISEAIHLLKIIPLASYCNLILTDRNNEAALVEINNSVKTIKRISKASEKKYLCSTNHYILPQMQHLVKNRMQQSVDRYKAIVTTLETAAVEKNSLKKLLSTHMPKGLACHHYSEGLGTMWAVLYDLTSLEAEICFGSPVVNEWYTFGLNTKEGIYEYTAVLPDEEADPDIWQRI